MPKMHPKTPPKNHPKNRPTKGRPKTKPEPVNITKSKFYWISLTVITVVAVVVFGVFYGIALAPLGLILVTALSVIGLAGYARLKTSNLPLKTRATYLFVGAAVVGFSLWVALIIMLAVTGLGVQVQADLGGDQLFIITTQIIYLVVGAFIGEYLSTNNAFQSLSTKIKQKIGF
jgi:hypothetical protein